MPTIHAAPLTRFATELLAAGGLAADEAALVAGSLVGAKALAMTALDLLASPDALRQAKDDFARGGTAP